MNARGVAVDQGIRIAVTGLVGRLLLLVIAPRVTLAERKRAFCGRSEFQFPSLGDRFGRSPRDGTP